MVSVVNINGKPSLNTSHMPKCCSCKNSIRNDGINTRIEMLYLQRNAVWEIENFTSLSTISIDNCCTDNSHFYSLWLFRDKLRLEIRWIGHWESSFFFVGGLPIVCTRNSPLPTGRLSLQAEWLGGHSVFLLNRTSNKERLYWTGQS